MSTHTHTHTSRLFMILNLHSVEGGEKPVDGAKILLLVELGADPGMMTTRGQISDS